MASGHWRNCDFEDTDAEIADIDALEELLGAEDRATAGSVRSIP